MTYDQLAGSEGDPLLLVMGLAVSRFWWPAGLARRSPTAASPWPDTTSGMPGSPPGMPDTGASNPFAALARKRGAYSSEDMTDDAIAVLDALGWERRHVFGASLGGIVAQRVALRRDRVLSVVSAIATQDVSGIGGRSWAAAWCQLGPGPGSDGPDGDIQLALLARELVCGLPFDERGPGVDERDVDSGPGTRKREQAVGAAWHARSWASSRAGAGPARRPGPDPGSAPRATARPSTAPAW